MTCGVIRTSNDLGSDVVSEQLFITQTVNEHRKHRHAANTVSSTRCARVFYFTSRKENQWNTSGGAASSPICMLIELSSFKRPVVTSFRNLRSIQFEFEKMLVSPLTTVGGWMDGSWTSVCFLWILHLFPSFLSVPVVSESLRRARQIWVKVNRRWENRKRGGGGKEENSEVVFRGGIEALAEQTSESLKDLAFDSRMWEGGEKDVRGRNQRWLFYNEDGEVWEDPWTLSHHPSVWSFYQHL